MFMPGRQKQITLSLRLELTLLRHNSAHVISFCILKSRLIVRHISANIKDIWRCKEQFIQTDNMNKKQTTSEHSQQHVLGL